MARIERLEELRVYREWYAVAMRVFELGKTFPREETWALTDQVRRSSRGVGASLAETWRMRRYPRAFIRKLTDAEAEAEEARYWIVITRECGNLDGATARELDRTYDRIIARLVRMAHTASRWAIGAPDPATAPRRPGSPRTGSTPATEPGP